MKKINLYLIFISLIYLASCASSKSHRSPASNNFSSDDNSFSSATNEPYSHHQSFAFDWPVNEARLTRGFLPNKKRRPHLGIDLAAPKGTKILASHDGIVIYAGRDFKGFGKMILLESGQGWATIYGHLDKISIKEGQIVKQGQVIGLMGRTGRSTGVHLHFEIRKDKGPVDPLPLLPNGIEVANKIAKK